MTRNSLSRRRFGVALMTTSTLGLAGCQEVLNGDGDPDEVELEDPGTLVIILENEDGKRVHSGVDVTVEGEDVTTNLDDESNDEGEMTATVDPGEYTITAESAEDEFDTVEETVTVEEGEEAEVTLTLEGAPTGEEEEEEVDDEDEDEEEEEVDDEDEDEEE